MLMFVFTYVVRRDYGFAPNPFYGMCTLATCKPRIRTSASIGDWIFGVGSKTTHEGKLIYLMKVTEKMTFDDYWQDERFAVKKPQMTTLKRMYGDNIYHSDPYTNEWVQANSHHSLENGQPNPHNVNRDTKSNNVLVSSEFAYFGENAIEVPSHIYKSRRDYCKDEVTQTIRDFINDVKANPGFGYHGDPMLFTNFIRYDGVS